MNLGKILWVKFGWSEFYRGGPVNGNFLYLNDKEGEGHEAFNFMPGTDGRYYCYVPPHGPYAASPTSPEPDGWTVICLAKFPPQRGVHVVGWYENATLVGEQIARPEYAGRTGFRLDVNGGKFTYSIVADKAFFVPPEARSNPFSHPSVKQAKFSYLDGPGVAPNAARTEVLRILQKEVKRLRSIAVEQPTPISAPDDVEDEVDPLGRFGTPEHRRAVEMAAEKAVTVELEGLGYKVLRRSNEKIGYDLQAISSGTRDDLFVEVKGTSGTERRFYMTPNEREFTTTKGWRLAIVTQALDNPSVCFFTLRELERRFSIQPMVWIGREVEGEASRMNVPASLKATSGPQVKTGR